MLSLALRLLWRDWHSRQLAVTLYSLVIAVTTITAIALFVGRIQGAILDESSVLLGAEMRLSADSPVPEEWLQRATQLGLRRSRVLEFSSMLFAGDRPQLTLVKAVDENYPLRGALKVANQPFGEALATPVSPARGEIFLESRLFGALVLKPGQQVGVGDANLQVGLVLLEEPDRMGSSFAMAPRALMRIEDVPATGIIRPGSRVAYHYLLSGPARARAEFRAFLEEGRLQGQRLLEVGAVQPSVGDTLQRAESFLLLAGALGVVLSGLAIAMAVHRYSLRRLDQVAIMKALGATSARVQRLYLLLLLGLATLGTGLGWLLGWLGQLLVELVMRSFLPITLPPPGIEPFAIGAVTGFICLLAFALPPLLRLSGTPPLRVLRRDLAPVSLGSSLPYAVGLVGTAGLILWYTRDPVLTAIVLGALAVLALAVGVMAYLLLGLRTPLGINAGGVMRLAMASLRRNRLVGSLQVFVFALAIMLVLVLALARSSMLDQWETQLPRDAHNHFLFNLVSGELVAAGEFLDGRELVRSPFYPVSRARLVGLDHEAGLRPDADYAEREESLDRGYTVTYGAELPEDNEILEGIWWTSPEVVEVSVEEEYAQRTGIALGDRLHFRVADRELEAPVTSIRRVDWNRMTPSFFFIFSPAALEFAPVTYLLSFYLPAERKPLLNDLVSRFPTAALVEMDAVMGRVRHITGQISLAVEFVLVLIMLAGAMVLVAGVQTSTDERLRQTALLRALGASRRLLLGSLAVEFSLLGLLAGVFASLGAEVASYFLQTQVFEFDYRLYPWLWLLGPVLGVILIAGASLLASYRVTRTSPAQVLQAS